MTQARLGVIQKEIVRIGKEQQHKELADRELLAVFVAERDETAFAVLVKRHGPMVLRICERALRHRQDAEDAFQATFLLLARKASSIRKPAALASWLHGVAYRMAQNAKRAAARRRGHETSMARPATTAAPNHSWSDVQAILDAEIERLPEKYRTAFVLCHLQGQERTKVAVQLGLQEGTLSSRLAKARELLQGRLAQHGISLSTLLGAFALGSDAVARSVPPALTAATTAAAVKFSTGLSLRQVASAAVASLTEKAMRTMMVTRIVTVTLVLFALAGVGGVGHLAYQTVASQLAVPVTDEKPAAVALADDIPKKPTEVQPRTDAYGDPLPPGATMRLGTMRLRHPGHFVSRVVFTPDGKHIVSALSHRQGGVYVWEKATGRKVRHFDVSGVDDFALSPDGKVLALAQHSELGILNLVTGARQISRTGSGACFCVAISPDGKMVASGGLTKNSSEPVALWDAATGKKLRSLSGRSPQVTCLSFSPDGKALAAACCSYEQFPPPEGPRSSEIVRVWDIASGELHILDGHTAGLTSVAYSPDGKVLASAGHDGKICFWNASRKTLLRKIQVAGEYDLDKGNRTSARGVSSVAFSPDGKILASVQFGGTVRLWDAGSGKQLHVLRSQFGRVATLAFSPDGKAVAGAIDGTVRLWDPATGKLLSNRPGHERSVVGLGISRDGKRAVSAGDHTVRLWNLTTGQEIAAITGFKHIRSFAVSPDGEVLAVGEQDGTIELRDAKGRELHRLRGHAGAVDWTCFSPDGKLLASASSKMVVNREYVNHGSIRIWELATGREVRQIDDNKGNVYYHCVRFSPDGKWLGASGYRRGQEHGLETWEVATGRKGLHFPGLQGFAFLPNGKTIVRWSEQENSIPNGKPVPVGGVPSTVRFLNLADGKELYSFQGPRGVNNFGYPFALSPDGRMLALGTDRERVVWQADIRLLELTTGKLRRTLKAHSGDVTQLIFTPDGQSLISACGDTTMLVWDVARRLEQGSRRVTNADLALLWRDLGADDGERADKAIWQLVAASHQALPFLRKAMSPVAVPGAARLDALVADLRSDMFATRDKANRDLESLGELAEPALRKTLADSPTLELRLRIERLLERLKPPVTATERIREIRAVEVLEHIGSAEAKQLLRTLSQGAPGAWLTKEARTSLERLER